MVDHRTKETKAHSGTCTCPACMPDLWAAGIKGVRGDLMKQQGSFTSNDLLTKLRWIGSIAAFKEPDIARACADAAGEIERLTRDRDEIAASRHADAQQWREAIAERDRLRAALERIASREADAREIVDQNRWPSTLAIDLAGMARLALSGEPSPVETSGDSEVERLTRERDHFQTLAAVRGRELLKRAELLQEVQAQVDQLKCSHGWSAGMCPAEDCVHYPQDSCYRHCEVFPKGRGCPKCNAEKASECQHSRFEPGCTLKPCHPSATHANVWEYRCGVCQQQFSLAIGEAQLSQNG